MSAFVLRAEATSRIGMGHVARLSALGAALVARGGSCVLAARDVSDEVAAFIARSGIELARLASDAPDEVADLAKARDAKWIAIDRYDIDARSIQSLRARGCFVLYVDDTGLAASSAAHVVVNTNFFADAIAYPENLRVLRGPRYALLRREFTAFRDAEKSVNEAPRILVTMGGADVNALTTRVVDAISLLARDVTVDVVVGAAHRDPKSVAAHVEKISGATLTVNASDMAARIAAADVVVTTAGSTCLEIACIGRRALAIPVAENQVPVADALRRAALMRVGRPDDDARELSRVLASLLDEDGSGAIERQRALVDGRGAERVADVLSSDAP